MKMKKTDLPSTINHNGIEFSGVNWGEMNVSNIHLPAGADAAPLLAGLKNDHCQCPHWGMVLQGAIQVTYEDGASETVAAGEVYYWPPGHKVAATGDYEAMEFSPAREMDAVLDHLKAKLGL